MTIPGHTALEKNPVNYDINTANQFLLQLSMYKTPFQSLLIHKNNQLLLQSFNQEGTANTDMY